MNFDDEYIKCDITCKNNKININGIIKNPQLYNNVIIMASNPIDNITSYSGGHLPFPSSSIAFENTKNYHKVNLYSGGLYNILFTYPNSYYSNILDKKIVSSLYFIFEDLNGVKNFKQLELEDINKIKSLINRESRTGPEFYYMKELLIPPLSAYNTMLGYKYIKECNNLG